MDWHLYLEFTYSEYCPEHRLYFKHVEYWRTFITVQRLKQVKKLAKLHNASNIPFLLWLANRSDGGQLSLMEHTKNLQ